MVAVVDVGLESRVDMAVVELAVEDKEDRVCGLLVKNHGCENWERTIVHKRSNEFRLRPLRLRVVLFSKLVPSTFVCNGDLWEVVVEDSLVEVNDELLNRSGTSSQDQRDVTHSLHRVRDLSKRILLNHMLLHCNQGGFINRLLNRNCR